MQPQTAFLIYHYFHNNATSNLYVVADIDVADKLSIGAGVLELFKKPVCSIV